MLFWWYTFQPWNLLSRFVWHKKHRIHLGSLPSTDIMSEELWLKKKCLKRSKHILELCHSSGPAGVHGRKHDSNTCLYMLLPLFWPGWMPPSSKRRLFKVRSKRKKPARNTGLVFWALQLFHRSVLQHCKCFQQSHGCQNLILYTIGMLVRALAVEVSCKTLKIAPHALLPPFEGSCSKDSRGSSDLEALSWTSHADDTVRARCFPLPITCSWMPASGSLKNCGNKSFYIYAPLSIDLSCFFSICFVCV